MNPSAAAAADTGGLARLLGLDAADIAALIGRLAAAGITVATAESLTGGLLTALFTEVPGSSAVVRGGLVVYATDLKHTLAGVDPDLLAERGPVDPDVAVALARGARTRCRSDIGIGLTGVAGPGEQDGVAVGTWFVALAGFEDSTVRLARGAADPTPGAAPPSRSVVRSAAIRGAVALLMESVPTS